MIPDTTERVPLSTAAAVNEAIAASTRDNVDRYSGRSAARIEQRLRELEAEWDTERTLEANAALLALTGTVLGAAVNKRWFWLPAVVTTFLFQHAVQGWCPPLPVLRRLGFRTQSEIEQERYALKALRGDFKGIDKGSSVDEVLQAVQ